MTTSEPARNLRRALVPIHPLTVRITHWLNAVAIVVMIGSGWRIWNSSPIFDFHFPVGVTLGGDVELSQDVHNETGLAGALQWHFAAMWLLVLNGIAYFAYGILSGHFRRTMFPVGPAAFVRDAVAALRFRLSHRLGAYNAVQKTLYLGVLADGVIMVLSGLSIWKPGQFQELAFLFGGFDTARLVHFLGMAAIVLFLLVHLVLVIIVPKTLPTMITGRAPASQVEETAADFPGGAAE
jgi:thiosulfate reductase cytochrome b subunit